MTVGSLSMGTVKLLVDEVKNIITYIREGLTSDVPESRVWIASKNLTPRRMH